MEKSNKRSSILKRPLAEDSSPKFTRSRRRISFSEKKNVKVFAPGNDGATIWIKSYEESAEISTINSTRTLYSGSLVTPELIMRLRNNKTVSKVPTVTKKAKISQGVENVPPVNIPNEREEQPYGKFNESEDISLMISEMQQLLKSEERLPLRPITQYSKQIEEAESYVSPQASITFQSPEKVYCSFAVTNNDIRALSKFNNGKRLNLTLTDIISDYDKKTLQKNHQFNNLDVSLTPMDIENEGSVSLSCPMGNIPKPKRETMFNLENIELASVEKAPNKRSTIYYFDSLELTLKKNEKQRLKPLDTPYEIDKGTLVKDYDKENTEIGFDNTDMEFSFASIMHDLENVRNKDDVNKENRGYIENDNFMALSECKSAVQSVDNQQNQLLVHDFTAQNEIDVDKMDILLSPGSVHHSLQIKPSGNLETVHQSYGSSSTLQNANNDNEPVNLIKKHDTILCITATQGTENLCNDGRDCAGRRQTINIPCNMDLTLQDELQTTADESVQPKNRDFKNDQHMNSSIEALQISIKESEVNKHEKIDSKINRGTLHNHVDLDFTLEEKLGENTEPKNRDFKNDECMNISIETSKISMEESKVSKHEKIDSRVKRGTLHNHVDLDFTLEEKSGENTEPKNRDFKNNQCMNSSIETSQISIKESEVNKHEKIDSRIKRGTLHNHVDLDFTLEEKSGENTEPKNRDFKNDECMNISIENTEISMEESKVSKHEKIDSRVKRGTLHNHVDLDFTLEEKSGENTEPKNRDFKNNQCMNVSIENSQISIKESEVNKYEKIYSRIKRGTLHNHVDLDFTMEEKSGENTEPKNLDFKNNQCMNVSIESSEISKEESKVSTHEKIDSRKKRGTLYNHVDLDFTLEEKSGENTEPKNRDFKNDECMNISIENTEISMEESKVSKHEKIDSRVKRGTLHNHVDLDFTLEEKSGENTEPKNWDFKNNQCMNVSIENSQISIKESEVNKYEKIYSRIKRGTLHNHVDLDFTMEEKSGENTEPKNLDFKNNQCMNVSIESSEISKEESKVSTHEKIDSRKKRGTLHNHVDLDFTLEEKLGENTEPKNQDFRNDECMNISIENSEISMEESKVSRHEKIDSRKKRGTLYNYVDLDFTLEEVSQDKCTQQADSKGIEIETNTNFTKEIQERTGQNEEPRLETTSKSYHVKSADLHMGDKNVGKINTTDFSILQKTNQYEEENSKMNRRSVYTTLDMDMDEEADHIYIKQADLRKDTQSCFKLEEHVRKNNNGKQKMNSSISFSQQDRSDVEFMKWLPTSAAVSSCDENIAKKDVILSAKRQTIYDQCDLDISMQDESAKIAESNDSVPVDLQIMKEIDDYDGSKCNLMNNAENNTILSIKRQMSFPSADLDLIIQNDLKDIKNGEVNNEQIMDTNYTTTSAKNNIEHHIKPFNSIENEKTLKLDEHRIKEPMTLTLHKISNKSCGKTSSNSVQTFDFSMEECANGSQLENMGNLKSTEYNMGINSPGNINLSGCEQLDQTSEVIFCDLSSHSAINSGIEQLRNIEIATKTSPEITSSSHTNTTFSANTTQALCNFDLSKITKKGYKSNLRMISDFKCKDKFKDTFLDNTYEYIPPMAPSVPAAGENQEINLSINNLNLNCPIKDANLKNDNCENILKSQQTIESIKLNRKSSCSRCKLCDCKPNTAGNKSEVLDFSWKFEAPPPRSEVDFSGYEKFQSLPSIKDILDAHKTRRQSLIFESYEESVFSPPIPTLEFLLENYEKQYKLQVKNELPVGAMFPLTQSLEMLIRNKLESEHLGWKSNTLCIPVGIMEFRHNIIPSVTLILKYSPDLFYSDDEKLIFEKVQLKISKLYGNQSPLDKIIENEVCLKAPYDLVNYCSCFNDLFSFLSFMNNICVQAIKLGKELFRRVVAFNGSLQTDSSDVFIKKRVLYTPRCNQKGLMGTQDFLIQVKKIENISYTDIMLPPLSDFKESICLIPEGLEFLTKFFSDPISYLKMKY